MEKSNITVTMPIKEYERLMAIEKDFFLYMDAFKRANPNGDSVFFTEELQELVLDVYNKSYYYRTDSFMR